MSEPSKSISDQLADAYLAGPLSPMVLRMTAAAYMDLVDERKKMGKTQGPKWCGCDIRVDLEKDSPKPFEFV